MILHGYIKRLPEGSHFFCCVRSKSKIIGCLWSLHYQPKSLYEIEQCPRRSGYVNNYEKPPLLLGKTHVISMTMASSSQTVTNYQRVTPISPWFMLHISILYVRNDRMVVTVFPLSYHPIISQLPGRWHCEKIHRQSSMGRVSHLMIYDLGSSMVIHG